MTGQEWVALTDLLVADRIRGSNRLLLSKQEKTNEHLL
jgi:hypothetical protein